MDNERFVARLRKRIAVNSPGLTIAVVALVVALTGGAFAAAGSLTGKQKKEVKAIAKQFAGKDGSSGSNGAAGPQGALGPQGAKGDAGSPGTAGKDGTNGTSITVTPIDTGIALECEARGGALVKEDKASGAEVEVCNGEKGEQGEPWTPNNTLPPGAIETGTWALNASGFAKESVVYASISFPVQLAAILNEFHVHFQDDANFADFCKASLVRPAGNPELGTTNPPGELCVYRPEGSPGLNNATFEGIFQYPTANFGTGRSGAFLGFKVTADPVSGGGTWAVTGCSTTEPGPNECPA